MATSVFTYHAHLGEDVRRGEDLCETTWPPLVFTDRSCLGEDLRFGEDMCETSRPPLLAQWGRAFALVFLPCLRPGGMGHPSALTQKMNEGIVNNLC